MEKEWKELTIARMRCVPHEYLLNGLTINECIAEVENETPLGQSLVNMDRAYFEWIKNELAKADSEYFRQIQERGELDGHFFKERGIWHRSKDSNPD